MEHINNFQNLKNNINNTFCLSYKRILNNNDLCDFIKTFIIKFIEIVNKDKKTINKNIIVFDSSVSAGKVLINDEKKVLISFSKLMNI